MIARRRAVPHPADDALKDRGKAKKIIGEIDRQMFAHLEASARHISVYVGRTVGNAEASQVMADERSHAGSGFGWRHVPLHEVIGKIRERIAQSRELPVEHGENFWLRRSQNDVVESIVAMHQPHRRRGWKIQRQPRDQSLHLLDRLGLGSAILFGPAFDLARYIIFAAPEVG